MKICYPTGVSNPVISNRKSRRSSKHSKKRAKRPKMKSYQVKPAKPGKAPKASKRGKKKRSKYNAHKIHAYGHVFDSEVEFGYYCYLRFHLHAHFKLHKWFRILPKTDYIGKVDGKKHHIRPHRYTPDFCIYDKHGNLEKVIDIKGMSKRGTAYDHLRFDLFSYFYHVPVYTVVKRHGRFITQIWGR